MLDYTYAAKLDRVVDGDTVWLFVDLGFNVTVHLDFRLNGINAPELHGPTQAAGQASKTALEALLVGAAIEIKSTKSEKYGRWLASIIAIANGKRVDVNQAMIEQGFAKPYDGRGPRP